MADYKYITHHQNGPIAVIILNRPESMNALSPVLVVELRKAVTEVAKDEEVKVLIVTGAGKAWSAGLDLKEMNAGIENGQFAADKILRDGEEVIRLLQTMPQPTIAAVNGYCFTGALELMMCFDIVIAANEAKIGDTHAKWGVIPKWGMSQRLSQLVGPMKARELSFTCEAISGEEAARIGLVNKSVPLAELDDAVNEMVNKILANSPQTIAAMKHLFHVGEHTTLKEGLKMELEYEGEITDRVAFLKDFSKNK
ncbi:MAG: enoyl-CoA hydratase/isomerase family protein [Bacteroidota bacterium]